MLNKGPDEWVLNDPFWAQWCLAGKREDEEKNAYVGSLFVGSIFGLQGNVFPRV